MRTLSLLLMLMLPVTAYAGPAEDEAAKAAVAVELAKLVLKSDVPTDLTKPAPPGWEKVSINGGPWHFQRIKPAVSEVTAPKTFRSSGYHAGHNCPSCGRSQFVVSGWNRDGTHNHTCASCGTVWNH